MSEYEHPRRAQGRAPSALDPSPDPGSDLSPDPGFDPRLDPRASALEPRSRAVPMVPPGEETGFVFACMGGSIRKGTWEPPETLYALSLMGGVELDFREAALLEGITEVKVLAIMGSVKIIVPEDVDVEVNGIGLMGGFDHVSHHGPGDDRPLIRIQGLALMGGVDIKVRRPAGPGRVERLARRMRELI